MQRPSQLPVNYWSHNQQDAYEQQVAAAEVTPEQQAELAFINEAIHARKVQGVYVTMCHRSGIYPVIK